MKDGSRFRVVDLESGRRWDVEAIRGRHDNRTEFGDSLYEQCRGAITEDESQISDETHRNVHYAKNPLEAI